MTLVCDDQNQIQAHKVILSACSDFFRNILLRNAAVSQPFIFLDNVSFQDLENVISFMYNGETAIGQEDLSSFMRSAQRLRVKGLSEQYSKEVPGMPHAERRYRRGPRRARYKSVIKKEEPVEPVKYLNVVDALARSIETLDNENEEKEEENSENESLFVEFEQFPLARADDKINLDNDDEGGDNENENNEEGEDEKEKHRDDDEDANQKKSITEENTYDEEEEEEEDLENHVEEEFEDQNNEDPTDGGDDSKDFLPNEDEQFTDTESEGDDEDTMDGIEESIELEDVYEYIKDYDGDSYDASNEEEKEHKDDFLKIEMTLTEEEPLSNYVSRLRKQKRSLRRNIFKQDQNDQ